MNATLSNPRPATNGRRWHVPLLAVLALALGASSEAQVWTISGDDAQLGAYTGTLEVREGAGGELQVIRVVSLEDLRHSDGRGIDLVWTGTGRLTGPHAATASFSLLRADFIPRVGDLVRTEADATPLQVTADAQIGDDLALAIDYSAAADPDLSVTETAVLTGPSGAEPIWRGERFVRETHSEPDTLEKLALFATFRRFHALPEVQSFTSDPAFRRAVHFQMVERTDFDYYRANPDRLRVVDKMVDAIGLAETEIRANAFRDTLAEKAAFYQDGLTNEFVGLHGMVVNSIDPRGEEEPDLDGALWTGVYTVTQALRYAATGEPEALDNLRPSLRGLLTLMDITGDPRTFARTLRPAGPALEEAWRRGEGEFSHLDWRVGGNNDMSKGLLLGMIAGWEALPEGDPLREAIRTHALALLDLCVFLESPPPECGPDDSELDLPKVNPGAAKLLAGITNEDASLVAEGLAWLRQPLLLQYADSGAGPFYIFGASDWSGNHVTLTTTMAVQWLLARTDDRELEARWIRASARAWETLRRLEHPLHAALAVAKGAFDDPVQRTQAREQALWGLRSFPFPKHPYPVDHSIRADFVISPFPSRPWRPGWETDAGRRQLLTAPPLLELGLDSYRWNDGHFDIAFQGLGERRVPGVDYLILYWIARAGGLITPLE